MDKCKVIGCENRVMGIEDNSREKSMVGNYGYCQIHMIEGLVKIVRKSQKGVQDR